MIPIVVFAFMGIAFVILDLVVVDANLVLRDFTALIVRTFATKLKPVQGMGGAFCQMDRAFALRDGQELHVRDSLVMPKLMLKQYKI